MPWFDVIWTPETIAHLARHNVTTEDFEEVVFAAQTIRTNKTAPRFEVVGMRPDGRLLKCLFERHDSATIIPVTPFELV
jgi:uncharacterized DUF497 family protein